MEQWLTTGDLGVVFGCTSGNVLKTIVPHVKAEHCRREKGRNKYRVDAVVAAHLAWRVRQHDEKQRRTAAELAAGGDEMLSGPKGLPEGSSPALEAYRVERAALAKLDRLERERALLPREAVHTALARVAAVIRGTGESLQRQFGPEAQQTLNEALDDAEREIDSLCGPLDDSTRDEPGGP